VAARANGHRIGIYMGTPLEVHVDGAVADVAQPVDLGSGAAVKRLSDGVEVDFPDGTVLSALSVGRYGINAVVSPSAALAKDGTGLLGPVAPGGLGVPALPNGARLRAVVDAHERFAQVYGPFADAWRVTDATSLFDYTAGKSTASYTNRAYPAEARTPGGGPPTPETLTTAAAACTAISDPALNADCIADVAATGDTGFTASYAATQAFYDSGPAGPSTTAAAPAATPPAVVDGATRVTDVYAFGAATFGGPDVLYVTLQPSQTATVLLAVDAKSGAILQHVDLAAPVTNLHFAAGSVWAPDLEDGSGTGCLVTRFDGTSLARLATIKVVCDPSGKAVIASNGDEIWSLDTSALDASGKGAVMRRINPATNALDTTVPLPFLGGYFFDSQGALFVGDSTPARGMYRLTEGASAFDSLGAYSGVIHTAGTGFWQNSSDGNAAVLTTGPGATQQVPLTGGFLASGDTKGIYVEQPTATGDELWRLPADGSPAIRLAMAPTVDNQPLDYAGNALPSFAPGDGYLHLWIPSGTKALYTQWVPNP
jgi:hypothetical protein